VQTYDEICGFLVIGWALHYLPFYLMDRQLFLHHYFPALWFAILCFCAVFDLVTRRVKRTRRIQAAGAIVIFALLAYGKFSPLTYGNKWTKAQCEKAKWLRTWDFSWCGRVRIAILLLPVAHRNPPCSADFYDSYSDYDALDKASQPSKAFAASPQQTTAPPPAIDLAEESEEDITVTITSTIYQVRIVRLPLHHHSSIRF
jgi:dolichyl-phosphate-mannose-protein mannosyltransferase